MEANEIWNKSQSFLNSYSNLSLVNGGIAIDDMNELEALIDKNAYRTNHNLDSIRIAEIGCWTGTSTSLLGHIAKRRSGSVKAIDWFQGADTSNLSECANVFNIKKICELNLRQQNLLEVVEVIESKSEDAVSRFPNEYFDVIFIDGDHRYSYVRADIVNWYPKLKIGGLICGHDCEVLIKNGIHSLYEKWEQFNWVGFHLGVSRALSELLPEAKKTDTGVVWYYVKPDGAPVK